MNGELNRRNTEYLESETQDDEPEMYQILINNDDFTPMEFVMGILETFFFMDRREAAEIMLTAHREGKAACGFFTKDVAESKIKEINDLAQSFEYPLICSMEAA